MIEFFRRPEVLRLVAQLCVLVFTFTTMVLASIAGIGEYILIAPLCAGHIDVAIGRPEST